jgi:hypothetical protein
VVVAFPHQSEPAYPELTERHRCRTVLLSCGCPASRRLPVRQRRIGWARPPRRFDGLVVLAYGGHVPFLGAACSLPQAWIPLQSVTRVSARRNMPAPSLSRGFIPQQRNPNVPSHRSRACLARVMLRPRGSCPPRRLAPGTISPMCFNRARSWGSPFRA